MIRFSACIEMLFRELEFGERIAACKKAGLDAFEFWGWQNKNLDEVERLSRELGLTIVACTVGSRRSEIADLWRKKGLVHLENHPVFLQALEESIDAASRLGINNLIVTVGQEDQEMERPAQHASIVEGLIKAAPMVNGI